MVYVKRRNKNLIDFQKKIGYTFNNQSLLKKALTHSSFANENKSVEWSNNERLEFLGDSVLNLVVSEYVYKNFPNDPEGELTKLRASIVCESSLAYAAKKLNLGDYLLLGKGEETTGGRYRNSIQADAFEALIGSIYLDGGLESSRQFIMNVLKNEVSKSTSFGYLFTDYKTKLQEELQKSNKANVKYIVVNEEGPDHNKTFYINLIIDGKIYGHGQGRSKKEAEQMAAKSGLKKLGVCYE